MSDYLLRVYLDPGEIGLDGYPYAWHEGPNISHPVSIKDSVREQAIRLLRLHPLRAADSLQLAAALEWAGSPPDGAFVTFDERLRVAAAREGFSTPYRARRVRTGLRRSSSNTVAVTQVA